MTIVMTLSTCTISAFAKDNEIYEERDQIELKNLNFDVNDDELHVTPKSKSVTSAENDIISTIEKSEVMQDLIIDMVNKGATPIAIGSTTVYLKDEVQADGTVVQVPMTKYDFEQSRTIGKPSYSPTKAFKLHTAASFIGTKIAATSSAEYVSKGLVGQSEFPQVGCYDYIGLTMPTQYTLTGDELTNKNIRSYTEDNTNNAILKGILLRPSPSAPAVTNIRLSAYGLKNSNVTNKKVISHYVHNWKSAKLSISFSSSGAGLSVSTSSKNWKISSYVVI